MVASHVLGKKPKYFSLFSLIFIFLLNNHYIFTRHVDARSNVHIVYMGDRRHGDVKKTTDSHHDMLTTVLGSKEAALDSMLYSYKHGFSGFAAKLTESQAQEIAELPGVVRVIPNHIIKLQTTRSWDYLGLSSSHSSTPTNYNLLHDTNMGDGAIIGLLDSGIWPESKSFNDDGLGPIPSRWKGICQTGEQFNSSHCNRKLIGARWHIKGFLAEYGQPFNTTENPEYLSPRDYLGHGTHVSSTAGGSFVANVSYKGLGLGTARGGAPRARLAMYKVCWNVLGEGNCASADILKAIDEAIHDGVDVLSLSLGGSVPMFSDVDEHDGIKIGSFHAVAKGITVVLAGGNNGPFSQTVDNTSPWMLTVAATTTDRSFPTPITLGDGRIILGQAMFVGKEIGFTGLTYPEGTGLNPSLAGVCEDLLLNGTSVAGKVVLCFTTVAHRTSSLLASSKVKAAGGVGVIVAKNPSNSIAACNDDFPCIQVDYELGTQILFYIRTQRTPKVKLSPSKTLVGKPVSTKLAWFSSRGPSSVAPAILKPDIAAPGVNILAATSPHDPRMDGGFSFMTGTSMATPVVSGIVTLLKSSHPDWSPAAIKSALVTTAWTTDPLGEPIFENGGQKLANSFDYGGGLVNPNRAANPGLIYDMGTSDYIHYLCSMGYNDSSISHLAQNQTVCPSKRPSILDVNVPAITVPSLRNSIILTRTVTNVGPVNSVYIAKINPPLGITVTVKPRALVFNSAKKSISFKVTVTTTHQENTGYYFGSLTWSDGVHSVRTPVTVRTQIIESYADNA